jgi:plastocyanin
MRPVRRGAVLLLTLAGLAGCGGGASTTTVTPATTPTAEQTAPVVADVPRVVLHETDYRISPARADGGHEGLVSIRFFNDGKVPHALAVDGPNGVVEFDGQVSPGHRGVLQVDLDRPGTYAMYCPLDGHRARGMAGTITVGGTQPARGAEPATTATTSSTTTTPTQTQTTKSQTTPTQTQTVTRTQTQTKTVTTPTTTTTTGPGGY